MTSIYIVKCEVYYETHDLRSFTTIEEAKRYAKLLDEETNKGLDFSNARFYVEECGLYNKIEDIDG
jgi:dsDNA-binding SOS-regulon protein